MKTREELLKEHAEELKALELETELAAILPIPPDSFCGPNWKAPYVSYRRTTEHFPRNVYSLIEALGIVKVYAPYIVTCEARKAGCTSVLPPAIQKKEYLEGAYRFDSVIQLTVDGGEGYSSTSLEFYVCIQDRHFRISIELERTHKWSPSMKREEDYRGRKYGKWIITPTGFGADHFIKWSSGDGTGRTNAYHITYHWETLDSFLTWVDGQK